MAFRRGLDGEQTALGIDRAADVIVAGGRLARALTLARARRSVLAPFCWGWELPRQPLGVLARGPHAAAQALMWRQWSQDVALFLPTVPRPAPEQLDHLAARGISIVEGEVTGVEVTGDRLSGL